MPKLRPAKPTTRESLMLSPPELAAAYDAYVAALWRREEADAFAAWLEAHWTTQPRPEPEDRPDAVSAPGGTAHRVHWHAAAGAILGYVTGRLHGYYWVPVNAAPPPIPTTQETGMVRQQLAENGG